MPNTSQQTAKPKLSERLVDFIQKKRIVLLASLAFVFIGISGTSGVFVFLESSEKKAAAYVEEMVGRYEELRAQSGDPAKAAEIVALAEEIKASTVLSRKSFSAARLHSLSGTISADRKEWQDAENSWLEAARISPKSYIAPVSLYNAAAAAEERGDGTKAIELYARSVDDYEGDFPMAPRALFAVGRLNEERKNFAEATAAYKRMVDAWPSDGWTKLARSRIISIAASGTAK